MKPRAAITLTFALMLATVLGTTAQTAELVIQTGHADRVAHVAVSPDARLIASGGYDGQIIIWDRSTGKQVRSLKGHSLHADVVAFLADGIHLISAGQPGELRLWDTRNGGIVWQTASAANLILSVATSERNAMIAVAGLGNEIELRDLATGVVRSTIKSNSHQVNALAFTPDERTLIAGTNELALEIWDITTRRLRDTISGFASSVTSVATNANGTLVVAADLQGNVRVYDLATGERRYEFSSGQARVVSVRFRPNSNSIAAASEIGGTVEWDLASGREISRIPIEASVRAMEFLPDGNALVLAHRETVEIWDLVSRSATRLKPEVAPINSVAFSPVDDTFVFAGPRAGVKLFPPSGSALKTIYPRQTTYWRSHYGERGLDVTLSQLEFSPDGKLLATEGEGRVKIWDVTTMADIQTLGDQGFQTFRFSDGGRSIITGDEKGWLKKWSVATGKRLLAHRLTNDRPILSFAVKPRTNKLLVHDFDFVRTFDLRTRTESGRIQEPTNAVVSAAVNPVEDAHAYAGMRQDVTIVGRTGPLELRAGGVVLSMAFSPNGRYLAIGATRNWLGVFDAASGELVRELSGAAGNNISVAFDRKGELLAAASTEGTARIWRVVDGTLLCTLVALGDDDWAVVAPDGRFDTSKDLNNIDGLHWVLSDDPLQPRSLELFMRQYYEPGLLGRLLKCASVGSCSDEFKPLPSIAEINRVQPQLVFANRR